jgi:colanic acid/amylovoran biosynthesis protein
MANFTITGVNFINKGAELMALAAQQEVFKWDPKNTISLPLRSGNFRQREEAGFKHLLWRPSKKIPFLNSMLGSTIFLPSRLRNHFSWILESEVDVILDASGFAYSDQWGPCLSEFWSSYYLKWKSQGKKIILLPQAFGPFEDQRVKEAFVKIIECADLVFPRDKISYEYVLNLNCSTKNIKLAPDFTNLVQPVLSGNKYTELFYRPCIVPNSRMIDKTSPQKGKIYISFLNSVIDQLIKADLQPFILLHEVNDLDLGLSLQKHAKRKIPLVQELNPLVAKGILGKTSFVISSRFHALISSFSQSIPCMGIGWSHKYEMLFQDYQCPNLLVNLDDKLAINREKLDLLINSQSRSNIIEIVSRNSKHQKELSQRMWAEVNKLIQY